MLLRIGLRVSCCFVIASKRAFFEWFSTLRRNLTELRQHILLITNAQPQCLALPKRHVHEPNLNPIWDDDRLLIWARDRRLNFMQRRHTHKTQPTILYD